jgi:hypothetical protein
VVNPAGAVQEQTQYPPGKVFDLLFFRTWRAHSQFHGNYWQHNAALKVLRDQLAPGSVGGGPAAAAVAAAGGVAAAVAAVDGQESMELQPHGMQVATVDHHKGMDYDVDYTRTKHWSWLEMVAQLEEDSMIRVVGGGLVKCEFSARPKSYAHDAHHAHRKASREQPKTKLRIYDFVLWRADGTGIRLHPKWGSTRIDSFGVDGHKEEVEPPASGPGGSDGKGTFKTYKNASTQDVLRFDPDKKPK